MIIQKLLSLFNCSQVYYIGRNDILPSPLSPVEEKKALEDLSVAEYKEFSDVIGEDVYHSLQLENILNKRNIIGGVAPAQTEVEIENLKKLLSSREG